MICFHLMRQPTNSRNSIASTLNTSPLWVKTSLVLAKTLAASEGFEKIYSLYTNNKNIE